MMWIRTIAAFSGLGLAVAIIWALGQRSLWDSFPEVAADPWGLVTIIDLYAGLALIAVVIALVEPRLRSALPWIILLPFLGNVIAALWMVVRAKRLLELAQRLGD